MAACGQPPPVVATPLPSPEAGVLDVTILLDLSGDRRPSGTAQRNAIQLWLDQRQTRGPAPVRTRVKTVDVESSDAKLLIALRRATDEERADAVIIGVPITRELGGFVAATDVAALPVLTTLPLDGAQSGRWLFGLAPTREELAKAALDDATARGVGRAGVLLFAQDTALARSEALALMTEARRRGDQLLTTANLDGADRTPPDVITRLLTVTSSVHVVGAPRDGAAITRGNIGPLSYLSYVTEPSELGSFKDVTLAQWPASRDLVMAAIPPTPTVVARRQFLQAYTDRHGPPSSAAAAAYDALTLLELVAETAGPHDRARMRDRLEATSVALIATTYSFSATKHTGPQLDDLAYVRWTGSALALAVDPRLR
ncbi:MAG: ABC transporter substrate-binding protein [Chloroflexi bacterium]|nr:ABC transporter substrate-binding protein [Chloroflexota bacterium]